MKKLENKVSVITGAGSGMGKAMAKLFAAEGSKIVAADINLERLETLRDEIKGSGGDVSIIVVDMSEGLQVENMIRYASDTYGSLDILVNNAGIMDNFAPVGELDDKIWEKVMKVNIDGPMRAMRSAVQLFLVKKSGVIINICSVGGLKGGVAGAAYTASKHALIGLTKNTGYMYSKSGIRCNGIAPGAVNTNIAESIDMSKITPLVNDRIFSGLALNPRTGEANEIAESALFLASDSSSFINGTILVVDGGWSAY